MVHDLRNFAILLSVFVAAGCGQKDDDDDDKGSGTYPNFYSASKLAVPNFQRTSIGLSSLVTKNFNLAGAVPSTTTNFGSATDWSNVIAANSNTLGQLLVDAGPSGTMKSLWTILSQAQSTIDGINTNNSDVTGNPANCTALTSANTVVTPFWNTATDSIVSIADTGKYTCYTENNGTITAFGRSPVTTPPATCTDAFEYYVVTAYGLTGPNSSDPSYGATRDGGSATRFYYHGCDKTLKLQIAAHTKYSGGAEFSLRTEVEGNTGTSAFKMRSAWVDISGTGGGSMNSIVGNGTTFSVGGTNGSFLIGDLVGNCPTATSCSAPTGAFNYCVSNTGATSTTMSVAATTTCSENTTMASGYTSMTPITDATGTTAGVPRALFSVSKAAMGLP
jgi:hypothetical protein